MKKILSSSTMLTAVLALSAAFANSNAASKIYVSSAAVSNNTNLAQADYEALTWVLVSAVGMRGETGKKTNVITYDTWDTAVTQKAKGITDAGSPDLEVARIPTDAGQIILRAAAAVGNNNCFAFKEVRADGVTGGTGTILYDRGLVMGPTRPGGRNEDFDIEKFTLGLQQEQIVVNPSTSGVAPYVTAVPAISGTASPASVLTCSTGTWSGDATIVYAYQWYANNIAIPGATASTFTVTSAQLGTRITARVNASNAAGSASSTTAPTAAVA